VKVNDGEFLFCLSFRLGEITCAADALCPILLLSEAVVIVEVVLEVALVVVVVVVVVVVDNVYLLFLFLRLGEIMCAAGALYTDALFLCQ